MSAQPHVAVAAIDRTAAIEWYRRNRSRSRAIFDLVVPAAYYSRPIALRNPIVFYEGHLPAFSVIAFLRRGLGRPPVDERLETLFARGIDPDSVDAAVPRSGASTIWPSRDDVLAFAERCDRAIIDALEHDPDLPLEGLYTALEHEAMHQETLLYMWHRLPYEQKFRNAMTDGRWAMGDGRSPMGDGRWTMGDGRLPTGDGRLPTGDGRLPMGDGRSPTAAASVVIAAGDARLGADRNAVSFGWDNEFDAHLVHVGEFEVDTLPVTNERFLEFLNDGGYQRRELWSDEGWEWLQAEGISHPAFWQRSSSIDHRPSSIAHRSPALDNAWLWRGMFHSEPLPPHQPVYVSHAEAAAYARWKGRRLMTEPEFHRAAYGSPSAGDAANEPPAGFYDFQGFDPVPVGSFPPSPLGVYDLVGNGWEWTSTVFAPFDGFTPMTSYPEYSADFFDGRHYVLKGASPATARELVRPSFRNWFRGNYPYVYAKFRTAQ